ncbi:hypothetical protein GBAR_LOCUS14077 [Geodia barretti]|uniref:Uncharacterized protein n=1 Tax=Geodia barretti TaxID=519541 RepID=A0AA35S670_GEOBA|nr:hypothetical protein GBAR_LOCUS14077 [Geodia barretti]
MRTGKITRRGLTNSSFSDGAPPVMKCVLYVVLQACALALLCNTLPDQEGNGCTSGFMSVDRMDHLLGNKGGVIPSENYQGIFPEVGFTCSGSIEGWVFGARWVGGNDREFTELQIWRPTRDGAYTKVGNTTINTDRISSGFYEYPLSSPLDFQAGDVLGYYQPHSDQSQLRLQFEDGGRRKNQTGYYYIGSSSASDLYLPWGAMSTRYQILVNVITNSTDCVRGFVSVERIRLLLGVDPTYGIEYNSQRQQISPEIKITCNGLITKWIIGADWTSSVSSYLYPELQVWRNVGNETYRKMSGTHVFFPFSARANRIYEYTKFAPIPVESGDILGIFTPSPSRLRLRFENDNSNNPKVYYRSTDNSATSSPYEELDRQNNDPSLATASYYPLVSLEIERYPPSSVLILPSSSLISTATSPLPTSRAPVPSTDQPSSGQSSAAIAAGVGGGVAVALVLLMVALLLVILVVFVKRRRQDSKPLENVEHKGGFSPLGNPVYTGISGSGRASAATDHTLGELYETPQTQDEGEALYDAPSPENGGATNAKEASTTFAKFDNPLYEDN